MLLHSDSHSSLDHFTMDEHISNWQGSPEERIIRELYRTSEGGVKAGTDSVDYGRILETLLKRELQKLATEMHNGDLRFARGYLVEDYGSQKFKGASAAHASDVSTKESPRFDIIAYSGDVAWGSFDGLPHALVPSSFARGIIEVKRTLSPGYLPPDSSRAMNLQFHRQRDYIKELAPDVPFILIGAHYSGNPEEIRRKALATHVALLGNLSGAGSARKMAQPGELTNVIKILSGESPYDDERGNQLQAIAKRMLEE